MTLEATLHLILSDSKSTGSGLQGVVHPKLMKSQGKRSRKRQMRSGSNERLGRPEKTGFCFLEKVQDEFGWPYLAVVLLAAVI